MDDCTCDWAAGSGFHTPCPVHAQRRVVQAAPAAETPREQDRCACGAGTFDLKDHGTGACLVNGRVVWASERAPAAETPPPRECEVCIERAPAEADSWRQAAEAYKRELDESRAALAALRARLLKQIEGWESGDVRSPDRKYARTLRIILDGEG